jgi:hypothetical protein
MAQSVRLQIEVEGDSIIVTQPGTRCLVAYQKRVDAPGLVATNMRRDPNPSIRQPDFLARAWRAANEKARELGWIG